MLFTETPDWLISKTITKNKRY